MSDYNPGELTASGAKPVSDVFDEDGDDVDVVPAPRRPVREGLPSSYRMRADDHYVDELMTSRRIDRRSEIAGTALDRDEPESARPAPPAPDAELLAQLAESIAIIDNAAGLLAVETSPLTRRVSADLIRAHAWRAGWMLQATRVLDGSHRVSPKSRQLGVLFNQLRDRFDPECRLAGVGLRLHAADWTTAVVVDETLLVAGISGALLAMAGVVGDAEGVTIRATAVVSSGELRTIEIVQDDVPVAADLATRFFDRAAANRPGGWMAALGAATAKAMALRAGGDATFTRGERAGCAIRLDLNRPF